MAELSVDNSSIYVTFASLRFVAFFRFKISRRNVGYMAIWHYKSYLPYLLLFEDFPIAIMPTGLFYCQNSQGRELFQLQPIHTAENNFQSLQTILKSTLQNQYVTLFFFFVSQRTHKNYWM